MSFDVKEFMNSRWGFWIAVAVAGLAISGAWAKADDRYLKKSDFHEWRSNQGLTQEMKDALAVLTASARANADNLIGLTADVKYLRQNVEKQNGKP